jgi:hypothetical protein
MSSEEIGIILKISLGIYKKRLKFEEVRKVVKLII